MTSTKSWWSDRFNRFVLLLVALVLCGSVLYSLSEPYPLSHAHWDSAVYLLSAKDYSQGDLLARVRAHASAVHDELMSGGFPREYWVFTRLGHIALLGTAVSVLGTENVSIGALVNLYRLVFAAGVLSAAVLSIRAIRTLTPDVPEISVYTGAGISLALYLLSDIASYMSGNLVSEVPALLLVSLSAWTFVVAWQKRSWTYAAMSGFLGWMLYAVRVESVWLYISFLVAFAAIATPVSRRDWVVFAVAAGSSAFMFVLYSWAFLPLTDPRLFAAATTTGVKLLGASAGGTGSEIVAANGLLWLGATAALPIGWSNKSARLGFAWLLLAMIPIAIAVSASYGMQTRMFTTLTPALLLLSTVGWSNIVLRMRESHSRFAPAALLLLCGAGVAISQPITFAHLRTIPGLWRLQVAHEFLASKRFERIDYRLPELLALRSALANVRDPYTLIASPGMQAADHIMVLQYMGPVRPNNASREGISAAPTLDVHLSETTGTDLRYIESLAKGRRIFLVGTVAENDWFESFSGRGVLREVGDRGNFRLVEISRPIIDIRQTHLMAGSK